MLQVMPGEPNMINFEKQKSHLVKIDHKKPIRDQSVSELYCIFFSPF